MVLWSFMVVRDGSLRVVVDCSWGGVSAPGFL